MVVHRFPGFARGGSGARSCQTTTRVPSSGQRATPGNLTRTTILRASTSTPRLGEEAAVRSRDYELPVPMHT